MAGRIPDPDDQAIFDALLAGQRDKAFKLLQRRYADPLHGFALRMVRDCHLADDVMQETFLQIYKNLHTAKDPASLRAWVFRIVHNRALDAIKQRVRQQGRIIANEIPEDAADPTDPPDVQAMLAEENSDLERCLRELPRGVRKLILMRFVAGLSLEEIGEVVGKQPDTVRMSIARALPKLRTCLEAGGVKR